MSELKVLNLKDVNLPGRDTPKRVFSPKPEKGVCFIFPEKDGVCRILHSPPNKNANEKASGKAIAFDRAYKVSVEGMDLADLVSRTLVLELSSDITGNVVAYSEDTVEVNCAEKSGGIYLLDDVGFCRNTELIMVKSKVPFQLTLL